MTQLKLKQKFIEIKMKYSRKLTKHYKIHT